MGKIEETIFKAWIDKNPGLLKTIIASEFIWHEDSFSPAVTDINKLVIQWNEDIKRHQDVSINSSQILKKGLVTVTHWRAKFLKDNKQVEIDGIFVIAEDKNGKLSEFKQWTQTR